jgi:hypothetical protein
MSAQHLQHCTKNQGQDKERDIRALHRGPHPVKVKRSERYYRPGHEAERQNDSR